MFEILKQRYKKNFVRKDQLQKYVILGKITQEQYFDITGEKQKSEQTEEEF
ncbi:XkdX family protein [Clostridium sp. MD294]|uniref:XkdX family protein n=1 Tax=Clostridium sp. MD294 TaxID=97138 RepID=UPI0002C9491F|nr:XkdX family protein [Clostridium sp. MD294]NDO45958.1 XkdX family protein [Clostridium sp. MD294]NDO45959.1 XkdX family protein [Clostridium sp. MD294]USF30383.1 hypothetical protein C820_001824 [Clostridium sp. MD294]USF31173.1 hypothetical protein C820_002619 [Clostridium sp. MD294]